MIEESITPMSQDDLGKIQINDEVIVTIASLAAVEVDGIVNIAGGSSLAEVWGSKSHRKGVSVTTDDANHWATIDVEVNVEYGADVYKAARQVQLQVKNAVERMTGLHVRGVNVRISGIVMSEKPRPEPVTKQPDQHAVARMPEKKTVQEN